jgi:hypothetical protein
LAPPLGELSAKLTERAFARSLSNIGLTERAFARSLSNIGVTERAASAGTFAAADAQTAVPPFTKAAKRSILCCGGSGGKLFNRTVENRGFPFYAKPPTVVVFGLF